MAYDIKDLPLPIEGQGFTWCMVAPRGSGKSYLTGQVLDMYLEHGIFKEKNVHIFCPTIDLNEDYDRFEHVNKYPSVNPRDIMQIVDEAQKIIKHYGKHKMPRVLIILDDCLAENGLITKAGGPLEKIFVRGRHMNISIILISQQLHRINNTLRKNTSYWTMFKPYDMEETENFLKKMVLSYERKAFLSRFMEVWEEPYQFTFIDMITKNYDRRFRIGFETPMFLRRNKKQKVSAVEDDLESE